MSSKCDVRRQGQNVVACMRDLHEQRPSSRSCRHFKDVAAVVENRGIKMGRSLKCYMGKYRVA